MADATATSRESSNRGFAFVLATVAINMLGVGLAWPILPKLVEEMAGAGVSEAAYAYAWIAALYAVAQFLFAPLVGAVSDAHGRRPVLLASQAALALDYLLIVLVPNLWWLALLRFASGMFAATVSTANAFVADISTVENRSRNFGYIGATFGIGFILGPIFGGLLGEISLRLPFLVAGVLTVANVAFGWFSLPESHPPERRETLDWMKANPLTAFGRMSRFPSLAPLIVAHGLSGLAQRGLEATWILYTSFRFGWGIAEAAFSLAFVGVCYFVVQSTLVGPIVKRFGERTTLLAGLVLGAISMLFYALATEGWMAYPLIAIYCVGNAVAQPALLGLASGQVTEREQGLLQGTMAGVNSLMIIVGPLAASLILALATRDDAGWLPAGLWFLIAAMLYLAAIATVRRPTR